MRIKELKLVAYGKFTDQVLAFPRSPHDFQVIIGPNEAGKSTVRRAIGELLFGMERQHPLGFLHDQSDLKLGAVLEGASGVLQFMRTKNLKSLRTVAGDTLPENYLAPALGALTKDTLENLHSLDHSALVKGGQGIVDPKNTVSQILFQATSGLKTFGTVRDALMDRSSALFSTRSRKTEYVAAADRLAEAQKLLREAQVQTKAWVQASEALENAKKDLEEEHKRRATLEQQRSVWERSRRVGTRLETFDRLREELSRTEETLSFPAGSKKVLDSGITELQAAAAVVETCERHRDERKQELDVIELDNDTLLSEAEVERLRELTGVCSKYPTDIESRKKEVELWLRDALARSKQFGWGEDEATMRQLAPVDRVLRTLDALLRERGALLEAHRAAQGVEKDRQDELDGLEQQSQAETVAVEQPELAQALEEALPYKTTDLKLVGLRAAAVEAKTKVGRELKALGYDHLTVDGLRTLKLPSPDRVSALRTERQELHGQYMLALSRQEEAQQQAAQLQLQVSQYSKAHKVVTPGEVSTARSERDGVWGAIKAGSVTLSEGAPKLDLNLRLADELADGRMVSEADGASLQALKDQQEGAANQAKLHEEAAKSKKQLLCEFDARWGELVEQARLPGLDLDDMADWLARREQVLLAAESHESKEEQARLEQEAAEHARSALEVACLGAGLSLSSGTRLLQLCLAADNHLKAINAAQLKKRSLEQRHQAADTALQLAKKTATERAAAHDDWELRWTQALGKANLQAAELAEVEAAIQAGREIQQLLTKIDAHRVERIGAMQAELDHLNDTAKALAQALAPELLQSSAQEIARALASRVQKANTQSKSHETATRALQAAERELQEAQTKHSQVQGRLSPILQIASVQDATLALPLVEAYESLKALEEQVKTALTAVEQESDGLNVDALRQEQEQFPAARAPGEIQAIVDSLKDSQHTGAELVQREVTAQQALDAIDGGTRAAVAEAQRQEAVADMSDASEEYLQLQTASTLLKWAVDRYRDKRQGPLIDRASAIFQSLTLGAFEKIRIEFDSEPPALLAYRASGKSVGIGGLSEGTRDQLFLALRIAALELQSAQSEPVPFIADDLFINFDDARSQAGLKALWHLSTLTQVIFLSHHEHLLPVLETMFEGVNTIVLDGAPALA